MPSKKNDKNARRKKDLGRQQRQRQLQQQIQEDAQTAEAASSNNVAGGAASANEQQQPMDALTQGALNRNGVVSVVDIKGDVDVASSQPPRPPMPPPRPLTPPNNAISVPFTQGVNLIAMVTTHLVEMSRRERLEQQAARMDEGAAEVAAAATNGDCVDGMSPVVVPRTNGNGQEHWVEQPRLFVALPPIEVVEDSNDTSRSSEVHQQQPQQQQQLQVQVRVQVHDPPSLDHHQADSPSLVNGNASGCSDDHVVNATELHQASSNTHLSPAAGHSGRTARPQPIDVDAILPADEDENLPASPTSIEVELPSRDPSPDIDYHGHHQNDHHMSSASSGTGTGTDGDLSSLAIGESIHDYDPYDEDLYYGEEEPPRLSAAAVDLENGDGGGDVVTVTWPAPAPASAAEPPLVWQIPRAAINTNDDGAADDDDDYQQRIRAAEEALLQQRLQAQQREIEIKTQKKPPTPPPRAAPRPSRQEPPAEPPREANDGEQLDVPADAPAANPADDQHNEPAEVAEVAGGGREEEAAAAPAGARPPADGGLCAQCPFRGERLPMCHQNRLEDRQNRAARRARQRNARQRPAIREPAWWEPGNEALDQPAPQMFMLIRRGEDAPDVVDDVQQGEAAVVAARVAARVAVAVAAADAVGGALDDAGHRVEEEEEEEKQDETTVETVGDDIVHHVHGARRGVEHAMNSFRQMFWVRAMRYSLTWSNMWADAAFGIRLWRGAQQPAPARPLAIEDAETRASRQRATTAISSNAASGRFAWQLGRSAFVFPVYAFVAMLLDMVLGVVRLLGH